MNHTTRPAATAFVSGPRPTPEREAAELASDGEVPYSDLVAATDALAKAGFVELAFVEPRALSAIPQL